jgi:DNA-binding NtrC family response regulator
VTLTQSGIAAPESHAMVASRNDDPVQDPGAGRGAAPVFADPQSRSVASLVERVAPTSVPVLIMGETGSGKERLARYIHERSGRTGEFSVTQCSAVLPGNNANASHGTRVTGLQSGHGAFDVRDGGTLFLDDVGELCPASQCELLRLLRENETLFREAENANASAVRVITSTSTDLGKGVLNGNFRRDLFYRLNIATVRVLPLRQRPDDIVPLANHFLRLHSGSSKPPTRTFGQDALAALRRHPWPGNVRELENVIRFAVLTAPRRELRAEDLRLEDPHLAASGLPPAPDQDVREPLPDELARLLARRVRNPGAHLYDEVEGLLVAEAFRAAGGNQVHTATLLGISRNVVRTLLKKHGLLNSSRKSDR